MPSEDLPKKTIGRFRAEVLLGQGAFASVYSAYDSVLQRQVALKVANDGVLSDPKRRRRFIREARTAARLRHPHIVVTYDAGVEGGRLYIASAVVKGSTLRELFSGKSVTPRTAAQIALDLADALAYAHGKNVVHRDVNPSNVMVDEQGNVLLIDFGLARLSEESEDLTIDGKFMGTAGYAAPEQLQGDRKDMAAADQYSVGAVLYELLCGRPPFEGSFEEAVYRTLNHEPPRLTQVSPDVPYDLEAICLKTLAKKPSERYADCSHLANDLRNWLEGEPVLARPRIEFHRWLRRHAVRIIQATLFLTLCWLIVAVSSRLLAVSRTVQELEGLETEQAQQERENVGIRVEIKRQTSELARVALEMDAAQSRVLALEETRAARDAERNVLSEAATVAADGSGPRERDGLKVRVRELGSQLAEKALFEALSDCQKQLSLGKPVTAAKALAACPVSHRGWTWNYLRQQVSRPSITELFNWNHFAFREDAESIVVAAGDTVAVHAAETGKELKTFKKSRMKHFHSISVDGRHVLLRTRSRGTIEWAVLSVETEDIVARHLVQHRNPVTVGRAARFFVEQRRGEIASVSDSSNEGRVAFRRPGLLAGKFTDYMVEGGVLSVLFMVDGRCELRKWNVETGENLPVIETKVPLPGEAVTAHFVGGEVWVTDHEQSMRFDAGLNEVGRFRPPFEITTVSSNGRFAVFNGCILFSLDGTRDPIALDHWSASALNGDAPAALNGPGTRVALRRGNARVQVFPLGDSGPELLLRTGSTALSSSGKCVVIRESGDVAIRKLVDQIVLGRVNDVGSRPIAISRDGRWYASWDVASQGSSTATAGGSIQVGVLGEPPTEILLDERPANCRRPIAVSQDGGAVAALHESSVVVYDPTRLAAPSSLAVTKPRFATFSGDGRQLALLRNATDNEGDKFELQLWDLETERLALSKAVGPSSTAVAFTPDDRRLAVLGEGWLGLCSRDGLNYVEIEFPYRGEELAFTPDGKSLVVRRGDYHFVFSPSDS